MTEISVIIPVYKVEKYLDRCVQSVMNQTFKDLEILLVDDGSPDTCPALCDEYAKKDPRIKVIHKENGGLSDARNAGIDVATGKYIGFVDSDDYIADDMYEYLYSLITENDADVSMCEFFHCYPGKEPVVNPDRPIMKVNSKEAIYTILESEKASVTVANKLYDKEKIFSNDLRFRKGKISEDAFIIVDILARAEKVIISGVQKYYYFHRADSITTIKFNNKDFDSIEAYDYDLERVRQIDKDYLENIALMRCCWVRFYVLDKMALAGVGNTPERKEIIRYLKAHKNIVLSTPILTKARKISFLTLYLGFGLYAKLAKLNYEKNKGHFA